VLNVAESRESKAPGIEQAVAARMEIVAKANGRFLYPLHDPTARK